MLGHIPIPTIAHDEAVLPNQPFFAWVRSHSTLLITLIEAIVGTVGGMAAFVYYVRKGSEGTAESDWLKPEKLSLVVDYAHILFIVIAILALIRVLNDNDRGHYRVGLVYTRVFDPNARELPPEFSEKLKNSKDRLKDFKKYFLWFWLSMFLLYVSFAFEHTYNLVASNQTSPAAAVQTQFYQDLLGSLKTNKSDWTGWLNPNQNSFKPADGVISFKDWRSRIPSGESITIAKLFEGFGFRWLNFALNNISILFIFWCYTVLYLPEKDKTRSRTHFWWSVSIVIGLSAVFPVILIIGKPIMDATDRNAYVAVFDALSGTLNALVFALLIARVDSKLIGLRSWLICILYSYAAIQPLFVVFGQDTEVLKRMMVSVLIFVLVSKIYFFLIIMYALQTGRMLNYLFCFPYLNEKVDAKKRELNEPPISQSAITWLCNALGVLALVYFLGSLITYAGELGGLRRFLRFLPRTLINYGYAFFHPPDTYIDGAQYVFVASAAIAILLIRFRSSMQHRVYDLAKSIFPDEAFETADKGNGLPRQVKRFQSYFVEFWAVTLPLYAVLWVKHQGWAIPMNFEANRFNSLVQVLWNPFLTFMLGTLNLLLIFWCFVILQSPVHEAPSSPAAAREGNAEKQRQVTNEARQKLLIHYSAFVVTMIIAAFLLLLFPVGGMRFNPSNLTDYATIFEGLTGILSAVALSLLIARLDSKLIDLPTSVIYILFAYAAIQPLLVIFEQNGAVFRNIEAATLTSALLLKICFFLIIFQVLRNGDLLTYLVCFPILHRRVDSIFDNQFEIRIARESAGVYSFSIWKKNHLVYLPGRLSKNRTMCDRKVKTIRKLMKDSASYKPDEVAGTHWLKIIDPKKPKETLCESIALRSLEDAERLKTESIDKIPYCKYDRS
jgi:hypothetical protein